MIIIHDITVPHKNILLKISNMVSDITRISKMVQNDRLPKNHIDEKVENVFFSLTTNNFFL